MRLFEFQRGELADISGKPAPGHGTEIINLDAVVSIVQYGEPGSINLSGGMSRYLTEAAAKRLIGAMRQG
jgi:hypothetical protein